MLWQTNMAGKWLVDAESIQEDWGYFEVQLQSEWTYNHNIPRINFRVYNYHSILYHF